MRRIYDDSKYDEVRDAIMLYVRNHINPKDVAEYSYGSNRVEPRLVRDAVERHLGNDYKFGKCEHAHGIGNNNAWEIIYMGEEEQICGLFHATDDMYGGVYCWVTDIDEERKTESMFLMDRPYWYAEHGAR